MILSFLKNQRVLVLLIVFFVIIQIQPLSAQPDPPSGGHGQSGNQIPGGGAPLASGLAILIALGSAYGTKKVFLQQKEEDAEIS